MENGFLDNRCIADGNPWCTISGIAESRMQLFLMLACIGGIVLVVLTKTTGSIATMLKKKKKMRWDRREGGVE
jgi:hypothetical protein